MLLDGFYLTVGELLDQFGTLQAVVELGADEGVAEGL